MRASGTWPGKPWASSAVVDHAGHGTAPEPGPFPAGQESPAEQMKETPVVCRHIVNLHHPCHSSGICVHLHHPPTRWKQSAHSRLGLS